MSIGFPRASLGLVIAGMLAVPAQAQLQLEEVIVMAQKREQNLQDVPVAVSAFTGDMLEQSGVEFHRNFEVGRDASLHDIRERHDAVLIATGVYKARDIKVPGVGLENVVPALDFLVASNRKGLGDKVEAFDDGSLNADGKDVVVIGGGDTAMDCVQIGRAHV